MTDLEPLIEAATEARREMNTARKAAKAAEAVLRDAENRYATRCEDLEDAVWKQVSIRAAEDDAKLTGCSCEEGDACSDCADAPKGKKACADDAGYCAESFSAAAGDDDDDCGVEQESPAEPALVIRVNNPALARRALESIAGVRS